MKVFKVKEPVLDTVFRWLMVMVLFNQAIGDEQLFS